MKTMNETTSKTYRKIFKIPCNTDRDQDIIDAIRMYTDFFEGMDDDELYMFLKSEWCDVCSDGVVVWGDFH